MRYETNDSRDDEVVGYDANVAGSIKMTTTVGGELNASSGGGQTHLGLGASGLVVGVAVGFGIALIML